MRVRLVDSIEEIDPEAWDALTGDDDPFIEHGFLRALERSGSVGEDAGWIPTHVTVWDGQRLVGGLPLYEKDHSYGEYIFDWAWADAAMRAGIRYYPKLVSMVPVTPATGRRILFAADVDREAVVAAVVEGAFQAADACDASSVHFLFVNDDERELLQANRRLRPRLTHQFHWHNEGYASFEDYLSRFRSSSRKQVRRERRKVVESGLVVKVKEGPELDEREWRALRTFYRDTCGRKGAYPYLKPRFFDELRDGPLQRVVAAFAYQADGTPVAATLNFEKGAHLYGRYWGCSEDHEFLHFELCYYALIERAIERGMKRFEAGAQGMHKLKRGLMPSPIHSVHWVRHAALAEAIDDYLPREAFSVAAQMAAMAERGPFKRDGE